MEVLQKYKGTPAPHIVLDGLKQKYIIQKDLRDYEDMCRRSTKELLDEISAQTGDNVTTWKTLETKISAWLVMNTTAKKDTGVIQNSIVEILELCSAFEINFFSVYQAVNEIKFSPVLKAASKKFDLVGSNGWSTNKMQFMITELERVRLERKELGKKLDKEVFQYKKKLFELSESNYICARVGKINSTYARLDHGNVEKTLASTYQP
ncbi:MAG: hypothetical protein EOP45_15625 [Sphingobacteriaceae bacterium]|nr:MAG: hypothetical protein EOP45_15625 [Sphingobacteriaceae bacterium]